MKAILMSIQPQWVAKILNGEKTIEVRKKFPANYRGWVYIYCTKNGEHLFRYGNKNFGETYTYNLGCGSLSLNGKVVARFYVDNVEEITNLGGQNIFETQTLDCIELLKKSCLYKEELDKYLIKEYEDTRGYAIYISQLEIFDRPKALSEFYYKRCNFDVCHKCSHYDVCNNGYKVYLTKAPKNYCYVEVE